MRSRNVALSLAGAALAVAPLSFLLGGVSFSEGVTVPVRVPPSAALVDDSGRTVPAHPKARQPRKPAPRPVDDRRSGGPTPENGSPAADHVAGDDGPGHDATDDRGSLAGGSTSRGTGGTTKRDDHGGGGGTSGGGTSGGGGHGSGHS